jgi:glycosyltransferase involved in cell wall biosynthesis
MTRELILNNAHRYNFIHIGGAVNHPEVGKIVDMSEAINSEVGIPDSHVLIYPYSGYGDPDLVRLLIERHNIDAIVHFTDPRYWIWLYRMSAEVRQRVPIFYYHIWDDLPAPHYNRPYYESCDLLMGISKQSVNISKLVLGKGNYVELTDKTPKELIGKSVPKTCYVPHGINHEIFKPLDRSDKSVQDMRSKLFNGANPDFVLFYNNRNIRRKMTSDAILAFALFYDSLPKNNTPDVRFVLHTQSVDENGTDLPAVIDAICPHLVDKIHITDVRLSPSDMCTMYNCCDVVINIASNEGWGLSSTEALMTGRVLINNVTGGLQDQCRFEDENGNWIEFNEKFATNHGGKYKKHGVWVKPVFPAGINLQGSIPTPYIFDDRANVRDVVEAIRYWYNVDSAERLKCGLEGRKWATSAEAGFTAQTMADRFSAAVNSVLDSWIAPKRFNLYNVEEETNKFKNKQSGISI